MIKINIIPEKIKKEIKLNFVFDLIRKTIYFSIIFSSLIAIVLMISEHTLFITLAKEMNNSSLSFKSNSTVYQNTTNDINSKLAQLEEIQKDYVPWSVFLNQISKDVPNNISINRLSIDKEENAISFSGNAKKREDLLEFKKMLEDSPLFTNIDFPTKNLLQKEDINFKINTKFKIDEIK